LILDIGYGIPDARYGMPDAGFRYELIGKIKKIKFLEIDRKIN